jgi:hypothetical protein
MRARVACRAARDGEADKSANGRLSWYLEVMQCKRNNDAGSFMKFPFVTLYLNMAVDVDYGFSNEFSYCSRVQL